MKAPRPLPDHVRGWLFMLLVGLGVWGLSDVFFFRGLSEWNSIRAGMGAAILAGAYWIASRR